MILATSAAEPAVEPKSIEPALRNCSALLDETVFTQQDLDAVLGEFLLEQALFLEQHRHRVVGRPVDADFLRLVGAEARGRQQAGQQRPKPERERRDRTLIRDLHSCAAARRETRGRWLMEAGKTICPPVSFVRRGGPRPL